jgi:hypothetical protein
MNESCRGSILSKKQENNKDNIFVWICIAISLLIGGICFLLGFRTIHLVNEPKQWSTTTGEVLSYNVKTININSRTNPETVYDLIINY